MAIKRRTRIWTSVGTAALLGSLTSCSEPADPPAMPDAQAQHDNGADQVWTSAGEGEGGEGEGTGGGGEFGIDPTEAETNPVVFLTALEVMRAHYLAGLDAFQAGDRTAGAEMFAHPISEIYIDFEPVLQARGAPLFGDTMTDASVAPYSGESDAAIAAHVADVLSAIDAASVFAPRNQLSPAGIHARVLTDLIERAVLQYEVLASHPEAREPYLDGYGFARAAQRYAGNHLEQVADGDPDLALELGRAIGALQAAFPTATRPEVLNGDSRNLLDLAANTRASANALR